MYCNRKTRSIFPLSQCQRNLMLLFSQYKTLHKTQIRCFFSFLTLKLFTLDFPAVRLTCQFHLYCWDHVCKVNEWWLVDCFHREFRVSIKIMVCNFA